MRYLNLATLMRCLVATGAALLVISLQGLAQASTVESKPQSLGNGTVRTYVELDDAGNATEVGVILSEGALANLPGETTEYVLPLPAEAETTAITHIGLNWQSHGHAPPAIYSTPHFDVHAYVITPQERQAITATNLETSYETPSPELIPAGYVLAPDSAEPLQGAHWIDPTAREFHGEPHGFDHTLIYGFYNGEMTFIEPMVTLAFLQSQQAFEGSVAVPQRYARTGSYPTAYRIAYNEATGEHIIALTEFTAQTADQTLAGD
jgi:Domain of unknown function (DUF5602)